MGNIFERWFVLVADAILELKAGLSLLPQPHSLRGALRPKFLGKLGKADCKYFFMVGSAKKSMYVLIFKCRRQFTNIDVVQKLEYSNLGPYGINCDSNFCACFRCLSPLLVTLQKNGSSLHYVAYCKHPLVREVTSSHQKLTPHSLFT